jgi:predicted nucleic-acid-binding protein
MAVVDSNVLVRLLTRDDPRQLESARAFVRQGVWVSILALAEAVWVLRTVSRRSAAELADLIEVLLNHQDLILQDAEAVEAALDTFRARPSLGFSDCLMLALARNSHSRRRPQSRDSGRFRNSHAASRKHTSA